MGDTFYRTVYFTLDDPADLELLKLILALPRSRRNRILKATLHGSLPRYLKRHHPEIIPLSPEAVAAAVKSAKRSLRRQSQSPRPWPADKAPGPPVPASPSGDGGHQLPSELTPPVPPQPSETEHRQEAERKLDRLLRTLAK